MIFYAVFVVKGLQLNWYWPDECKRHRSYVATLEIVAVAHYIPLPLLLLPYRLPPYIPLPLLPLPYRLPPYIPRPLLSLAYPLAFPVRCYPPISLLSATEHIK